ncbi:MAG: Gfo/Idh/MocA family oxidoreductase [Gammaproteobacteria bacterium]|nr:Gfo/Idh/MocA family oxidoreductase [Gammaproteobacteria bacterium]
MTPKIRMGVMGCANIAQKSLIPAMLKSEHIRLVAVASRSGQKAREFASQFDCEAVIAYENLLKRPDIDAIYMPLPTGLHEEWVTRSLKAGKHVLVEKSFAMDFASAQRMVELARASSLLVMENFMFLHHAQHGFVKNLIEAGEIGELRCFRSSFGFPPLAENNFRYDKALGGGALLDAAAYTIRASQLFLGNDLEVKAASLMTPSGAEVDIYGGAYLTSAGGAFSEVSFGFDNFYQCNYELWGSKGKLVAQRAFTPGPDFSPVISVDKQGERVDHQPGVDNQAINTLAEFAYCVHEGDYELKYSEIENQSRLLDQVRQLAQ